jgi:tricarballylate dehydrogenase
MRWRGSVPKNLRHLAVVGQGIAGLAAALSAAENASGRIRITVFDKAPAADAGGNTRWSPSNMRMASPERVEPQFVEDMLSATGWRGDHRYFERLASEAPGAIKWLQSLGIEFIQPPYYLAKGPPRIQPVGGGAKLIDVLRRAARNAGISFRYECAAQDIVTENGEITGLAIRDRATSEFVKTDAIVLACGGFQGDRTMLRAHLGQPAETMRLISPGTGFDTGDGIAMAARIGADRSGDWSGMHCEPVDARSKGSAPVVLVYPYGIVVDRTGRRFFDEGCGLMHETWERLAREIQFEAPGAIAFVVLDSQLLEIANYQRAIRSEVAPIKAETLAGLAQACGIDAAGLAETVHRYNAACTGDPDRFDATRCDGLSADRALIPPKSNWARALGKAPFLAFPIVGAIAYTFGGLATNADACVLRQRQPVPKLFAAGEITGHFYRTAPNAVSVLRALVFGRIAGQQAANVP